jgi:hypothetical protein
MKEVTTMYTRNYWVAVVKDGREEAVCLFYSPDDDMAAIIARSYVRSAIARSDGKLTKDSFKLRRLKEEYK